MLGKELLMVASADLKNHRQEVLAEGLEIKKKESSGMIVIFSTHHKN